MADEQADSGSWGDDVSQWASDAVSQAGDALKQGSDYIYAHTPEPIKDGVINAFSAVLGNETNAQPHTTLADQPAPPSTAPTGDATALPSNPIPAQNPAAPVTQPAPTDMELARAALICGYTAQNAPRQMTDADLSVYHGVSTNIIGARPDAFYRRWVIETTRDALPGSPAVCRAILADPHGAGQIVPDVRKLADLEKSFPKAQLQEERSLFSDGWIGVEHSVLNILGAAIKGDLDMSTSALAMRGSRLGAMIGAKLAGTDDPGEMRIPLISDIQDYRKDIGTSLQRRAAEPEHTPNRWAGMVTSGLTFVPFAETAPLVMGATSASAEAQRLMDEGIDPITAYIAGGLNGLILGAAQKIPLGNLKWGESILPWLKSIGGASAKAAVVGSAQSAASNAATALTLHAGGYPELGDQYWARIPADAWNSALFMLGLHLGGQAAARLASGSESASGAMPKPEKPAPELHGTEVRDGAPAPETDPSPLDVARHEQTRTALADGGRADDAIQAYKTLLQISEQAQRTALSKNNPAMLKQIVQGIADTSPLKDFYVDGEALAPVLEKSGMSPEAMEAILPGLNEAFSPNGLRIPVEALAAHPFLQEVLPDARIAPDAMSYSEAQARVERHAENIDRQGDETVGDEQDDVASDRQSHTRSGHPLFSDEEWAKYQSELQKMPPENRDIAVRFADKLRDLGAAAAEYARLKDSQGGKLLDTDLARELCPDYIRDRSKSQVIQTLSSAFVRKLFTEKLEAIERPKVLFSSGGPGSGKSTVIGEHSGMARAAASADIIYDTTMSNYDSARAMVKQVLDAGGNVRVALIIREPLDALENGAIRRAVMQEKKDGSGRTVPLDYFLNAHASAIRNVFHLAEEFKDNPEVKFRFMDNTHGLGNTKEVSLEQAKNIEFKDVEARARALLEKEYQDGKISKKIYTGFKFGGDDTGGAR